MPRSEEMKQFIEEYHRYIEEILIPTKDEIERLFETWKTPFYWERLANTNRMPIPSPVHSTMIRIKRSESAIDKILRKPSVFPDGLTSNSLHSISDAIGGRGVVYFLTNLSQFDHEIHNSELLEVSHENSPVAYLSDELSRRLGLLGTRRVSGGGYASIHYVVRFRTNYLPVCAGSLSLCDSNSRTIYLGDYSIFQVIKKGASAEAPF